MKKIKGLSMNLLTMIVIFIAVLALSIVLFNPGGIIESFKDILNKLNGTDTSTSLKNGFKAVHIYMGKAGYDLSNKRMHLYEFHPFNEPSNHLVIRSWKSLIEEIKEEVYLLIDIWKKDKCVVFVSDFTTSGVPIHQNGNRVYYVDLGTIIQDGIENLRSVLSNFEGRCNCAKNNKDLGEYNVLGPKDLFNIRCSNSATCSGVEIVLNYKFGESVIDECKRYENCMNCCPNKNCCSLLYKTDIGNYIYRIKYGIICGYNESSDEAYWWACTEDNSEMKIIALGKEYTCKFEEGIGKWTEEVRKQ